jgi:DNA-directed RNA polymerase specialized sigma24 family protein
MEKVTTKNRKLFNMKKLSDIEKISAIRSRNEYLTGEIYELYRNEFFNLFGKKLWKNSDVIHEIYQDTFLELCNKIYTHKLNESNLTSTLKTYMFGIGKYKLMATNRSNKNDFFELLSEIPDIIEDETDLSFENEKKIQIAVNNLGEPCHTILVKQYWEDKNGEEIAAELKYKNVDTLKTQKYKCMQKLKRSLDLESV